MPLAVVRNAARRRRPTTISLPSLIKRVADRFGDEAATQWTKAILNARNAINDDELRSAIASRNLNVIEGVVGPSRIEQLVQKYVEPSFLNAARTTGEASAVALRSKGIGLVFNAANPNVIQYARTQAAQLVTGVSKEVKQVIAEVIARGAERGLTTAQQAKAIKQVIGLPKHWAAAVDTFGNEIRDGRAGAAGARKISGKLKQQIRSRINNGTVDEAFVAKATAEYSNALLALRAKTIARTETIRAANRGLIESWDQGRKQGVLPAQTRVIWIVTEDDRLCDICIRIPEMNPDGRAIGESFMTPDGLVDAPPAPHPNCRCTVGLTFDAGAIEDDSTLIEPIAPPEEPPPAPPPAPPPLPLPPPLPELSAGDRLEFGDQYVEGMADLETGYDSVGAGKVWHDLTKREQEMYAMSNLKVEAADPSYMREQRALGLFHAYENKIEIAADLRADAVHSVTAHETGHFLDRMFLELSDPDEVAGTFWSTARPVTEDGSLGTSEVMKALRNDVENLKDRYRQEFWNSELKQVNDYVKSLEVSYGSKAGLYNSSESFTVEVTADLLSSNRFGAQVRNRFDGKLVSKHLPETQKLIKDKFKETFPWVNK